jgi:hypothetical protein
MKEIDVLLPFHEENSKFYAAVDSVNRSREVKVRLILIDDRKNPKPLTNKPGNSTVINSFGIGYAGALNIGKEYINSTYTAIMNSDDLVHPKRFLIQVQQLIEQNSQLCACGIQKFKEKRFVASGFGNLSSAGNLDRRVLLLGAYGVDATWCGRSDWWIKNVMFKNQQMSDWATGIKISEEFGIYIYPEKLYFYRQHSNQTTANAAFSSHGLEEIMNDWLDLARESYMGELSLREVAWVAAPRGRMPLDKTSIKRIADWLNQFDHTTNGLYSDLINRRYLLLLTSHPFNKYRFKELLSSASAAQSMATEKFLNFTTLRNLQLHD